MPSDKERSENPKPPDPISAKQLLESLYRAHATVEQGTHDSSKELPTRCFRPEMDTSSPGPWWFGFGYLKSDRSLKLQQSIQTGVGESFSQDCSSISPWPECRRMLFYGPDTRLARLGNRSHSTLGTPWWGLPFLGKVVRMRAFVQKAAIDFWSMDALHFKQFGRYLAVLHAPGYTNFSESEGKVIAKQIEARFQRVGWLKHNHRESYTIGTGMYWMFHDNVWFWVSIVIYSIIMWIYPPWTIVP